VHDEGASFWQVIVADLAQDGIPEVLMKSIDVAGFSVFEQDPSSPGTFLAPRRTGVPSAFNPGFRDRFDVGDVDGDLYPDVVMTTESDVLFFHQDPTAPGSFESAVRVGEGAGDIRIGDVDRDGLNDLVTLATHPDRNNLQVPDTWHFHRQNPSAPGSFLAPVSGSLESVGWALDLADLNNDGYVDIAVNSATGDNEFLIVFRQTPFDTFERLAPVATRLDAILGDMTIADLEGDGLPEIVSAMNTGANDPNVIQIYRQDNGAVYRPAAVLDITYPPVGQPFVFAVRVVDMNGDERPDIVVCSDEIFIYFQRAGSPGVFDGPTIVAAQR